MQSRVLVLVVTAECSAVVLRLSSSSRVYKYYNRNLLLKLTENISVHKYSLHTSAKNITFIYRDCFDNYKVGLMVISKMSFLCCECESEKPLFRLHRLTETR